VIVRQLSLFKATFIRRHGMYIGRKIPSHFKYGYADTCQLCKWSTPTAIIGRIGWLRAVPTASVSQEIMLDVRDRRPHPGAK
jgi:hypothetical protein